MSQDSTHKNKFLVDNLKILSYYINDLYKHVLNVDSAKFVLFAIRDVARLLERDQEKVSGNIIVEALVRYINDRIDSLAEILANDEFHNTEAGFELISNTIDTISDLIYKTLGELYDMENRVVNDSDNEEKDDYQDETNEDE